MTYVLTFMGGAFFGVLIMALCVVARDDREEDKHDSRGSDPEIPGASEGTQS